MREFEIIIQKDEALKHNFNIISDRISIVDLPGIDDGVMARQVKEYIEKNCESIIPIILINLTGVGF